jgi:hypothetical protein
MSNRLHFLFLGCLVCCTAFADERSCTEQLPVIVLLPGGALVRKLDKAQFVVRNKNNTLPVHSLTTDNGARRTVFVVETGGRVTEAARKIEAGVLSEILSNARPEDSFALLTADGPREEVRFGENRELLQSAVREFGIKPQGKQHPTGVLDAVSEAITWLQPHQSGDAILVMTMGIEQIMTMGIEQTYSHISYAKEREALISSGIRLFGFQLGPLIAGSWIPGRFPSQSSLGILSGNYESLQSLTRESGGFDYVENTVDLDKTYVLTDERLQVLKGGGRQIYRAIAEYYLVTVEAPHKDFVIDLSDKIRTKLPNATVVYPRKTISCAPTADSGPAHQGGDKPLSFLLIIRAGATSYCSQCD